MNRTPPTASFGINTYSYTFSRPAAACVRSAAEAGYCGIELMIYPGHLWEGASGDAGPAAVRRALEETGLAAVSVNGPNIDLNIAAAVEEMRAYSLRTLESHIRIAGEIGARFLVLGPGKANPLFPLDREILLGHFFAALDRLLPLADRCGVKISVENMPFAFLPSATDILDALAAYGHPGIGVIYDVANAHFIGEDPCAGLRLMQQRLDLVHLSDTTRTLYRHDPIGMGDVDFAAVPPVLAEIGYDRATMLEIISHRPDDDIAHGAARLAAMGFGPPYGPDAGA